MAREYSRAEVQSAGRYSFQAAEAGVPYTAFNMGSGESCLIQLLAMVQEMPEGGLIVIEEIDAGLHPQAQERLAEALCEIALRKKIQFVCTSHSEVFIDRLPRAARLLIRRSGEGHSVFEQPSTRFVVSEVTGRAEPEIVLYCEDAVAAAMVAHSLPADLLQRVDVREVGSGTTVIRQGVAHLRAGIRQSLLCILDGDCSEQDIERWITSESGGDAALTPDFVVLPGDGTPPESWVVAQLEHADYRAAFRDQVGCTGEEADRHIEALTVSVNQNPHSLGHELSERLNRSRVECIALLMRSVAPRHPQLDDLRSRIADSL